MKDGYCNPEWIRAHIGGSSPEYTPHDPEHARINALECAASALEHAYKRIDYLEHSLAGVCNQRDNATVWLLRLGKELGCLSSTVRDHDSNEHLLKAIRRMKRKNECDNCDGSGYISTTGDPDDEVICPKCKE